MLPQCPQSKEGGADCNMSITDVTEFVSLPVWLRGKDLCVLSEKFSTGMFLEKKELYVICKSY